MMRIALCSPGLTQQDVDARSVGLDFLARLIRQRFKTDAEFYTVKVRDIPKLGTYDVDFLFVSFVGVQSALMYAKAVKFKKPKPFTAIGGPAMLFPATYREMADVIMVGRGEQAIFDLIEGNYTGMMLKGSTLKDDEVHIGKPTILSPEQESCGCKFRCGFCSYSWMHTYATCKDHACKGFTSNHFTGSPQGEVMFKDMRFSMLSTSPFKRAGTGLDVLTPLDVRLVKKPMSFALVRHVISQMAQDAKTAFMGMYQMRLYTVTAYPWNDAPVELDYVRDTLKGIAFPEGVSIMMELTLNHFIPQITTPLECCAVRRDNLRTIFKDYQEPTWPTTGAFIHIDKHIVASPLQAVQQAILMRSDDPSVVVDVTTIADPDVLYGKYDALCGWQDHKPAPWIRRNNDNSARVAEFYQELYKRTSLRPPMPTGYTPFTSAEDRFNVPVADFGKKESRVRRGLSSGLRDML